MLRIQRIQSVAHPMTRNKFTFSNSRMLATSANGGVEKTIKTPSMGESITEGTLSQWLKSKRKRRRIILQKYLFIF